MARTLLEVNRLSKRFCRSPKLGGMYAAQDILNDALMKGTKNELRPGEFWALRDITFQLSPGEVVGMIGHNGAGKSTLINLVTGVLRPTAGSVHLSTRKVVTLSHHGGLDPVQTGRENIINQLSLNGLTKRAITHNIDAVVNFAEVGQAIDTPVGTYSWGMKLRLLFAIYSRLKPDLFVIDEALTGGDLRFSVKFRSFLDEYIAGGGSILLASHDLFSVQTLCSKCILLNHGEVISIGETVETIDQYQKLMAKTDESAQPMVEQNDNLSFFEELNVAPPTAEQPDVIQIGSVSIQSPDGSAIAPGGPARVLIECFCRETVSPIACSLLIQAANASRLAIVTNIQPELKEGRHVFTCLIESLPLVPATYQMLVSFTDPDKGIVFGIKGYYDKPIQFEIAAPLDRLTTLNRFFSTYLHLPALWTSEKTN
jgi:lipopolysaccharide transport system ATP-binding protein